MKTRMSLLLVLAVLSAACNDTDPIAPLDTAGTGTPLYSVVEPVMLFGQMTRGVAHSPGNVADDFQVPVGSTWNVTQVSMTTFGKPCDLRFFTHATGSTPVVIQLYPGVTATATTETIDNATFRHLITLPAPLTLGPGQYWLGASGACDSFWGFAWSQAVDGVLEAGRNYNTDWSEKTSSYTGGYVFALYGTAETGGTTPAFSFDLSSLAAMTYGDPAFSVADFASSNSSGAITFATGVGSAGCSVTDAGEVSITGAGTCMLEASLAPAGSYDGAGPLAQSFVIDKAASAVSIAGLPVSADVGDTFTLSYVKTGDGVASTTSTTPIICTVSGTTLSFIAPGTCTVTPAITAGPNYAAATGNPQSVTVEVGVFASECEYRVNPKNGQLNVDVHWQSASPGVTLIRLIDGRTVEKRLAPTATGQWTTNLKSSSATLTYELLGGATRREANEVLVSAGTRCELITP